MDDRREQMKDMKRELKQNAKDKSITEEERMQRDAFIRQAYSDPYYDPTPVEDEGAKYRRPF